MRRDSGESRLGGGRFNLRQRRRPLGHLVTAVDTSSTGQGCSFAPSLVRSCVCVSEGETVFLPNRTRIEPMNAQTND